MYPHKFHYQANWLQESIKLECYFAVSECAVCLIAKEILWGYFRDRPRLIHQLIPNESVKN
jgi:hypothetical protein